ncbi:SDR family oxidoreductase [Microcoleus sp. OTE_8_concoct_300]|uniref:SDR family oxidoreductase n=1 Tax=Microcoleus sp. OTE_8_concoct_300 TaxID=2964710 RepID=UPI00403F0205
MSEIESKVVIITGASSGLGEATARRLAASGAKLMLAARREDRLKDLVAAIEKTGGTVAYRVTDVADRAQVQALAEATLETYGRIDVLVNNAALMPLSPLDQIKVDEWDQMIDVNIKGVLYGIAAVLPTMRQQKSGHVINLSSIAGHKVVPGAAVYCATKYAVRAISEGLRLESNGEIRSTIISPGAMATEGLLRQSNREIRSTNISPDAVATELTSTITDGDTTSGVNQFYSLAMDADAIARAIAYAIEQPADVDVNEIMIRPSRQEF